MHRIDGPAATPTNFFTDGDPVAGVPATVVTDDWLNAVQEEVVAVITAAGIALSKPNNTQLLAAISALISANAVPAGITTTYAGDTAPGGWLVCDGSTVARASYTRLFTAIGTRYNTGGEAATVFRLPDARGVFLRGLDGGRGLDAGRTLGSLQTDAFKEHVHGIWRTTGGTATHAQQIEVVNGPAQGDELLDTTGNFITAAGVGNPETRPVNLSQVIIIKT